MSKNFIIILLSDEFINETLTLSIRAAGAAGKSLIVALDSSDDELHITSKEDGSLVSDADYASDKIISKIGCLPTLRRGLGVSSVNGCNLVPKPPAIKKTGLSYFLS